MLILWTRILPPFSPTHILRLHDKLIVSCLKGQFMLSDADTGIVSSKIYITNNSLLFWGF